jgi:hypothetical protein
MAISEDLLRLGPKLVIALREHLTDFGHGVGHYPFEGMNQAVYFVAIRFSHDLQPYGSQPGLGRPGVEEGRMSQQDYSPGGMAVEHQSCLRGSILFGTGTRRADWKVASRLVSMERVLLLGKYPSRVDPKHPAPNKRSETGT